MPRFDLQCKKCKAIREDVWLSVYQDMIMDVQNKCRKCKCKMFEVMAPLTAMQPDNMWSGTDTRFGYFTSKSQYEKTLRDKNIVTVDKKELDTVRKNVYNVKQDTKKKRQKSIHDFLAKELASVEISPDGTTQKERDLYVRKRQ
jgi:hypothetical protein